MHRTTSLFATAALLVATATACGGADAAENSALQGRGTGANCYIEAPVKIGAALSITGSAAAYGDAQRKSLELAVEQLNRSQGVRYELRIEDDATDPKQAITVFENFATNGMSAIIGPTLSNNAKQADPVAQASKVPVLAVSNTATGITDIGDYIFRNAMAESVIVPYTVVKAKEFAQLKKVVVMYSDDDAFTETGYQAFKKTLAGNDIQILQTMTFSKRDKDFRKLLAEAKALKPDALVVSSLIEPAIALVSQARDLGITVPIVGNNGFNSNRLITESGIAAEGVIVGGPWNAARPEQKNAEFLAAYRAKHNADPDPFGVMAYAGLLLIDEAIRKDCNAERDAIKRNLGTLREVDTIVGKYSFDSNREPVHNPVVQVVRDGRFVII